MTDPTPHEIAEDYASLQPDPYDKGLRASLITLSQAFGRVGHRADKAEAELAELKAKVGELRDNPQKFVKMSTDSNKIYRAIFEWAEQTIGPLFPSPRPETLRDAQIDKDNDDIDLGDPEG